MLVREFVEVMKNDVAISGLISVKKYISIDEKNDIASKVIEMSVDYERGFVKFDSMKKYLSFVFAAIESHTDLRFSDDWREKVKEYDLLCENDLLDIIVGEFEKDYKALHEVLDMMCNDMLIENSFEAGLSKLSQSAAENLDVLVGALADKIEGLDIEKIIPKDLDLNKLKGFLRNFK